MLIPVRTLRATADSADRNPPPLSDGELENRDRIRTLGQAVLAEHGRQSVNLTRLAAATRVSAHIFRKFFPDVDSFLFDILRRHLRAITTEFGNIPRDAPNRRQLQRAAYVAYTRTPLGGLTETHLLLVRDRVLLPPAERFGIEQMRLGIGDILAGPLAHEALALLDAPCFDTARIETMLATLTPPGLQETPPPAPPPEPLPEPENPPAPETAPATVMEAEPIIDIFTNPPEAPDDFLAQIGRHWRANIPPNQPPISQTAGKIPKREIIRLAGEPGRAPSSPSLALVTPATHSRDGP